MENLRRSPETPRPLRYPEGWRDILTAPDAFDYQTYMRNLSDLTQQACRDLAATPDWSEDVEEIRYRWQQVVEMVAGMSISPDDLQKLAEADIVEAGLITLEANIAAMGWDEEGLAFTVGNMFTGEESVIDLRELAYDPTL